MPFIKNTNNLDDKSKSKIKSALMRQKIYKDLSKTNSLVSHKKQKINKNDLINNKDKSNNNNAIKIINNINNIIINDTNINKKEMVININTNYFGNSIYSKVER